MPILKFQQGMELPSEVWPRDCILRKEMCLDSLSQLVSLPLGEVEVSPHPQEMVKPKWRGLGPGASVELLALLWNLNTEK